VRSARNPSRFYLVSGSGAGLQCTCPDFQQHAPQDSTWRCKHVLAVQDHLAKNAATDPQTESGLDEERAAVQGEGQVQPVNGEPTAAQMLIKRSISPDGRMDSDSIEFALPLADATVSEIRDRAAKTAKLQTEIVNGFLNGSNAKRNSGRANQSQANKGNGAAFARLVDVGVTNGQYGERFYLNVEVNGRRARLFGTAAQIAWAISTVGEKLFAQDIEPGLRVDLPCRVLTEESRDGRYLNVTRVLPLPSQGNSGARQ
jgi:SWIM zinc finger